MKLSAILALLPFVLFLSSCSPSTSTDNPNNGVNGNGGVKYVFAGTEHGLYRSTDLGRTWEKTPGPTYLPHGILKLNGKFLLTVGLNGLYTSMDSGLTWSHDPANNYFNGALAYYNGLVLAGTTRGLVASSDSGVTWSVVEQNTVALSFAEVDGFLVAGSYNGVLRTRDGRTWQRLNPLHAISMVARDTELLAAVPSQGVYHSFNDGETWMQMNTGIEYPYVTELTVSGKTLFVGTGSAFYHRGIADTAWALIHLPGETWKPIEVQTVDAKNGIVAAGSPSGGVYLSSDEGRTWSRSLPNSTDTAVRWISLQ